MRRLPKDLQEALSRGYCLPVVGWGVPDFVPLNEPILSDLLSPSDTVLNNNLDRFEREQNFLRWLAIAGPRVRPLFHAIAQLPVSFVLALSPDSLLPHTLRLEGDQWTVVKRDQPDYLLDSNILLPLGGQADDPRSLVLDASDLLGLRRGAEILWRHALSLATRFPLLVIGCPAKADALRRFLSDLRPTPPHGTAGWILTGAISARNRQAWESLGFGVVTGPIARLLRELANVGNRQRLKCATSTVTTQVRSSPYKRLDYFNREDADIFFGRRLDTKRLVDLVCAHRLTVISGPSGVGKTSLINAGLLAWVESTPDIAGIYARCEKNPVKSIQRATCNELRLPSDFPKDGESLVYFLIRVRDRIRKVPLIVIDQAEELFTQVGLELRRELAAALRDCLTATPLVARIVISLREDFLGRLTSLREEIPTLLQSAHLLKELKRKNALEAILEPSRVFGAEMKKELAETILEDISSDLVAPPQIQIVCSRLFEECQGRMDMETYKRVGGAKAILQSYLEGELKKLGSEEENARKILKAMVTSEGTKDVLSEREISNRSGLDQRLTTGILLHLRDRSRLLRTIREEGGRRFELAHEYLTVEIWSWMTPMEIQRREVEELLSRELNAWRRFRHLRLGMDRLRIFEEGAELLDLEEEAVTLLSLSAVSHLRSIEPWRNAARKLGPEAEDRITFRIFDHFRDRDLVRRREAAEVIAAMNPAPLVRALTSHDTKLQKAALLMSGGVGLTEALPNILKLVEHEDQELACLACGALGEIGHASGFDCLIKLARSERVPVAAASIVAVSVTGKEQAAGVIQEALESSNPLITRAGRRAVVNVGSSGLLRRLLKTSMSHRARRRLWEGISNARREVHVWISRISDDLSTAHYQDVITFFESVYMPASRLDKLSTQDNRLGAWAKKQMDRRSARRSTPMQESIDSLDAASPIENFANLLCDEDTGTHNAVCHKISDLLKACVLLNKTDMWPKILELLQDARPSVVQGTLQAVYSSGMAKEIRDDILQRCLNHKASMVRYMACFVVMAGKQITYVPHLRRLYDDRSSGYWLYKDIGETVGDAAAHALHRLNRASETWQKSFQEGAFRRGSPIQSKIDTLSVSSSTVEFVEAFRGKDFDMANAVCRRLCGLLKDKDMWPKVFELLQDAQPSVVSWALEAVYRSGKAEEIRDDILAGCLTHEAPEARYMACLVAMASEQITHMPRLRDLCDDKSPVGGYVSYVGGTVGEAAAYALRCFNPLSEAQQKTFNEASLGDETGRGEDVE